MATAKKSTSVKKNTSGKTVKKTTTLSASKTTIKKKFTNFTLRIRSRHPSADDLRKKVLIPAKAVYRHGSTTQVDDIKYEINSPESVQTAASKFKMKKAFQRGNVRTADWFFLSTDKKALRKVIGVENNELVYTKVERPDIPFPIVAKLNFGSRGRGMFKLENLQEFDNFLTKYYRTDYYFEKFYNFSREYRLHVDASGCFYSCRKVIKNDTPDDKRWYKNDSNCNWITQYEQVKQGEQFVRFNTNVKKELFDEPVNWKEVEAECVKALKAVGLDVGACDLRIQSAKDSKGIKRNNPEFIIVEINSAPAFGNLTTVMYKERLPQILKKKYEL
jgi:glutathione synthase/RimK-type ligase-like ATP-grasp enzyme